MGRKLVGSVGAPGEATLHLSPRRYIRNGLPNLYLQPPEQRSDLWELLKLPVVNLEEDFVECLNVGQTCLSTHGSLIEDPLAPI